ncbi:HAD-IA family hydrolase [Bacillaceae bacterium S4-13-58]
MIINCDGNTSCRRRVLILISVNFIWFDLGYTLVYMERETHYQQVLKDYNVEMSMEEITLAFHLADKFFMREHPGVLGKKDGNCTEHYHRILHGYLGIDVVPQLTNKLSSKQKQRPQWKAFDATIPVLQQLKEDGYGIGLISNWDLTARDVLKETGILPYLDHVVVSSEVSIEKPDKRIFEYAMSQAGVLPEECLYVGDNYYDDVIGSRKVSMESVVINPFASQGIEELTDVIVISNIKDLYTALPATKVLIGANNHDTNQ